MPRFTRVYVKYTIYSPPPDEFTAKRTETPRGVDSTIYCTIHLNPLTCPANFAASRPPPPPPPIRVIGFLLRFIVIMRAPATAQATLLHAVVKQTRLARVRELRNIRLFARIR